MFLGLPARVLLTQAYVLYYSEDYLNTVFHLFIKLMGERLVPGKCQFGPVSTTVVHRDSQIYDFGDDSPLEISAKKGGVLCVLWI